MNNIGKTLQSGYLDVGDGHELFYETYGNPEGIDVLFLHGGPGVGCSDADKRFFDPDIFHVIFLDQRGAPKSKPVGGLEHNTTQHLVDDINRLLDFLGVEKAIFFGGSWGTALSLVYAIQYPERVISMILRGIFLGIKDEIDHLFKREGAVELFFPEAYDRFIQLVPEKERNNIPRFFLDKMISDNPEIQKKYIYEWELFESSAIKLDSNPDATKSMLESMDDFGPSGKLVALYSANNCFLEDNYILKNAFKIAHIPTSIVHGRYDIICPPIYAYRLHKQLKKSELLMVKAGLATCL